MPTDEPYAASATAEVSVAAGGHLAVIAYTWSHREDGGQDGLLVIGPDEAPGKVAALWGDSWHQAPAARLLHGAIDGAVITVGASYAEGWDWNISVDATDAGSLRLRMDNVVPASAAAAQGQQGGAYWAMDAELRRAP
jgi:hypothetical protein